MDRELCIIVVICSMIVLLPVIGYIIYLLIKSKNDYKLVENMPLTVKSRLASEEAMTPLDAKSYFEYKDGLIREQKGLLLYLTLIIVVETILMLIKYRDMMIYVIKGNVIIYLILIVLFAASLGYKLFKLGDNVGIVKMQCEPLKYRIGGRERWLLVAFYDRDKMEFRKCRIYNGFNRLYIREGNYLLARHGVNKMRIIGLYQEKITPDNVTKTADFVTGWKMNK